jgi:FG-GAP repeat protein
MPFPFVRCLPIAALAAAGFAYAGPASAAGSPADGWLLQSTLALRGDDDGQLGRTVAVSGDWLAAGALFDPDSQTDAGAVFLFRRANGAWIPEGNLINPDPQANALFGGSLAMSGTHLLVGEPFYTSNGLSSAGRALFYELDVSTGTWNLITSYTFNQAAAYTGRSVAIDGDVAMVGVSGANAFSPPVSGAGGVVGWRFATTHWNSMGALIQASDPLENDAFGYSVAVQQNNGSSRIVVGAPGHTPIPSLDNSGAAYVFDVPVGAATQRAFLTAPNPASVDAFGLTVGFGPGSRVFIGAPGRNYNDQDGAGVVFDYAPAVGGYSLESLISRGLDAIPGDGFGNALAYDRATQALFVGAPRVNGFVVDEGAAYVFHPHPVSGGLLWDLVATLSLLDAPHAGDQLGSAIATDGQRAYVGAPFAPADDGIAQGRVRVFASDLIFTDDFDG